MPYTRRRRGIFFFDRLGIAIVICYNKNCWMGEVMGPNSKKIADVNNFKYNGSVKYNKKKESSGKKFLFARIFKYPEHECIVSTLSYKRRDEGVKTFWRYSPVSGWEKISKVSLLVDIWPNDYAYNSECMASREPTWDNPFYYGSRILGFPHRIIKQVDEKQT